MSSKKIGAATFMKLEEKLKKSSKREQVEKFPTFLKLEEDLKKKKNDLLDTYFTS